MCMPTRFEVILLCSLGMCFVHAMRVNIAVTVVTILDKAPYHKVGTVEAKLSLPNVNWDAPMIGWLHSSFFIGFLVTQIPSGYLVKKVPAHRVFGGGIILSCLFNLFLPLAITHLGFAGTVALRCLQGLAEGVIFPASYEILRHWSTPEGRSCMGSTVLTGVYAGAVIGFPVSGIITHFIGWQFVFYFHGIMGIVWAVIWLLVVYEKPSCHPRISMEELKMIQEKQGITATLYEHDRRIPWKNIFTSSAVWALNICNFARGFVYYFMLTNESVYLNVFGYNLAENGMVSAVPHILKTMVVGLSGPLADLVITTNKVSLTTVRKLFTGIGFGIESACLLALAFVSDRFAVILLLTIGVGISGIAVSGWQINHLDIAPRYASILVGLTTSFGNLAGIIMPVIVGHMTVDQTIGQWHNVFFLCSAIIFFAMFNYLFFGTGTRQKWAEPQIEPQIINSDPKLAEKAYTLRSMSIQQGSYGAAEETPLQEHMQRKEPFTAYSADEQHDEHSYLEPNIPPSEQNKNESPQTEPVDHSNRDKLLDNPLHRPD